METDQLIEVDEEALPGFMPGDSQSDTSHQKQLPAALPLDPGLFFVPIIALFAASSHGAPRL